MTNNGQVEFPNEAGIFSQEDYADRSVFYVSGNEDRTLAPISVPAIEIPPMETPPVSQAGIIEIFSTCSGDCVRNPC